jgi:hypothetical protein
MVIITTADTMWTYGKFINWFCDDNCFWFLICEEDKRKKERKTKLQTESKERVAQSCLQSHRGLVKLSIQGAS